MRLMTTRLIRRSLLLLVLYSLMTPALLMQNTSASFVAQAATAPDDANESQSAMNWRVTGPTGGDVRALVIDPNDSARLYFGTLDGQIYISNDGGGQWRLLYNFNRPKLFVDHIEIDPRDSRVIYVGGHRHKDPGGVFKT